MKRTEKSVSDIFEEYAELVKRYKDGDESAFAEIYDKSSRFVYATCLGVLENRDDACDAMQETYLAVYKNIDKLSDEKSLVRWIKRIAVTKATDMLRKKKGETYYDDAIESEEILEGDDDLESLPDYYIVEKTKRDTLHKLIRNALPDVQYQTVLFHYFDEMSVEEIASVMKCPVGTVKTRLKSSRILIKREVEKYEKDNNDKLEAYAGVPFLMGFFNAYAADIQVPDLLPFIKKIFEATTQGAKDPSSASNVAAATKTASSTVKTGFLAAATGKMIAFVIAFVLVVSVVIGTLVLQKDKEEPVKETEVSEDIDGESRADDTGLVEQLDDKVTEVEKTPLIEVDEKDLPDEYLLSSLLRWDYGGYDHTNPDEVFLKELFPYKAPYLLNFKDFFDDYRYNHDQLDPRGLFGERVCHHISLEKFEWIERNVLCFSEDDIEYFNNNILSTYEVDGVTAGAYIDGDTVWFYYDYALGDHAWTIRKILYDGEIYYVELLIDNYNARVNDPDYNIYTDGEYLFFELEHKEIDGFGFWAILSSSSDPSVFPGERAEIPSAKTAQEEPSETTQESEQE